MLHRCRMAGGRALRGAAARAHMRAHEGHAARRRRRPAAGAARLPRRQLGRACRPSTSARSGGSGRWACRPWPRRWSPRCSTCWCSWSRSAARAPTVRRRGLRRLRGAGPDHDADPQQRLRQLLVVAAAGQDERPDRRLPHPAAVAARAAGRLRAGRGDPRPVRRRGQPPSRCWPFAHLPIAQPWAVALLRPRRGADHGLARASWPASGRRSSTTWPR